MEWISVIDFLSLQLTPNPELNSRPVLLQIRHDLITVQLR